MANVGADFLGSGARDRLVTAFRRAIAALAGNYGARADFRASDFPTHKESHAGRVALDGLSRFQAGGHQAEQQWADYLTTCG